MILLVQCMLIPSSFRKLCRINDRIEGESRRQSGLSAILSAEQRHDALDDIWCEIDGIVEAAQVRQAY
jgi:hypothetical protein